jgi:6-phosphogluconate dehydrogenase
MGEIHITDTNRRVEELKGKKLHFFGMGISGRRRRRTERSEYDAGWR